MNSFVSSFYVEAPSIADRNTAGYDSEANLVVQRSICNLQRFTGFDLDPESLNLASSDTTKTLREVILVLCDDYDLSYAPGVKKAIDEFIENNNFKSSIISDGRFAKIEKK